MVSEISILCLKHRLFEVVSGTRHTSRARELRACKDWPFATFCRMHHDAIVTGNFDRFRLLSCAENAAQLLATH
jgi:hypothetical protein